MLARLRSKLTYPHVVSTLALFVAVGTGGAYAANEWNSSNIQDETLVSADVKGTNGTSTAKGTNGALTGADISGQPAIPASGQPFVTGSLGTFDVAEDSLTGADTKDNSLTGADTKDDSLTGADIQESTLDVGPLARSTTGTAGGCQPPEDFFVPCATVDLTLPRPGRVLLIAGAEWFSSTAEPAGATCAIAFEDDSDPNGFGRRIRFVNPGELTDSTSSDQPDQFSLSAVTDVLPAGLQLFALTCTHKLGSGDFRIALGDAHITALATGPQ